MASTPLPKNETPTIPDSGLPDWPRRDRDISLLADAIDVFYAGYRTSVGKPPTEGEAIIAYARLIANKKTADQARKWLRDLIVALDTELRKVSK